MQPAHLQQHIDWRRLIIFIAGSVNWSRSLVSAWRMGSIWSDAIIGGCFCCRYDIFISQVGAHFLDKSTFGTGKQFAFINGYDFAIVLMMTIIWIVTVASVTRPNDNWYYQVLLHLHIGIVCIWMRFESIALVLRWLGEEKMLSLPFRYSGFW